MSAALSRISKISKIAREAFRLDRVLIIDDGETATLILLAERIGTEIHILHHLSVPSELTDPEHLIPETIAQLKAEYDPFGIILIIPESESVSQRIRLKDRSIDEFVEHESQRFEKLEGNLPLIDHQLLEASNDVSESTYWLTYCQPNVVRKRLHRLGLELNELEDVTSTAQGLWGFFEASGRIDRSAYVVDVGQKHSSIMAIEKGQPVFATSFIAPLQNLQKDHDHEFQNDHEIHKVQNEDREIHKVKNDHDEVYEDRNHSFASIENWFRRLQNAPSNLHAFQNQDLQFSSDQEFVLLGEDGLVNAVKTALRAKLGRGIQFHKLHKKPLAPTQFGVAFGVASAALGTASLRISLLSKGDRSRQDRRLLWSRLRAGTPFFAALTLVCLMIGSLEKWRLSHFKEGLLADAQKAISQTIETENALSEFALHYEQVRPILRFQQETSQLIQTLHALSKSSDHPDFWLVLLADGRSYATKTNQLAPLPLTTPLSEHSGFVAEFSFSSEGGAMRAQLLELVRQLKASGLYAKVDTLAEDVRRPLAKSEVVSNRHIALWLQLHRNYFQNKLRSFGETSAQKEGLKMQTFDQRNVQIQDPSIQN